MVVVPALLLHPEGLVVVLTEGMVQGQAVDMLDLALLVELVELDRLMVARIMEL